MEIIKRGEIVTSTFVHLGDEDALPADGAPMDVTVTLARWQSERQALRAHPGAVGVRLSPDDELEPLLPDLDALALVAVEFPRFTDGRGYSLARLLRERHGYRGELRAVGNVLRDQLFYMHRCGFDAFELQPGKSIHDALSAFEELSVRYQAGADEPHPLFRRRVGSGM
ncbi:DUF934 domain-containing protein [Paraliomyxa miuraensis]|uniref:DUF934 domain-containing protein n=1 Tax=Paraliomyxa miuraensis TaxID=376150 RepID=UPI00225052BB|nr:DUF934 domain-containing protein [Paraliomyxa miuraensis]MCX4243881.1 DUF934 domain-containing protein [Paraliomyxa miuraensis]